MGGSSSIKPRTCRRTKARLDIRTEVPIRDVLGRVVDLFFAGAAFALDGAIGDEVHAFRDPADNLLGYGNLLYLEGGTHPPPDRRNGCRSRGRPPRSEVSASNCRGRSPIAEGIRDLLGAAFSSDDADDGRALIISLTSDSAVILMSARMLTIPPSNLGISARSGGRCSKLPIATIAFLPNPPISIIDDSRRWPSPYIRRNDAYTNVGYTLHTRKALNPKSFTVDVVNAGRERPVMDQEGGVQGDGRRLGSDLAEPCREEQPPPAFAICSYQTKNPKDNRICALIPGREKPFRIAFLGRSRHRFSRLPDRIAEPMTKHPR